MSNFNGWIPGFPGLETVYVFPRVELDAFGRQKVPNGQKGGLPLGMEALNL